MKNTISKTQAQQVIHDFFHLPSFTQDEVKKIKRLAMKHRIKLGIYRKLFCKHCLSQLKGRIKITKTHKTIICEKCRHKNKFTLS